MAELGAGPPAAPKPEPEDVAVTGLLPLTALLELPRKEDARRRHPNAIQIQFRDDPGAYNSFLGIPQDVKCEL